MTIYLPAGPGFGTGRHETTASCLELLQQIPLGGKDLIDFGCGSGILSLGALCLGARHVWLHDHDNQALSAAQQHLINHAFEEKATLCVSSEMLPTVDVLVANILCDILCSFERLFWNLVHPEGLAIFAGILEEQHDIFLKAFEKWSFVSQKNHGPWRSYILQKPAARFDS
jgi:ribosomal protein L11 methyltransferase